MSANYFYVTGVALSQFVLGAEALGIHARELMKRVGLNAEHLQPSARVPEIQYEMLLLQLSLYSQLDSLGTAIGQQVMPSLYGTLTSVLLNSPRVGAGLQNVIAYQSLASGNCGGFEYRLSDSGAALLMTMTHRNPVVRRLVAECVFTLFCFLLRLMSGNRALAPQSIWLEHAPLSRQARQQFESAVGCPVSWGQPSSRLVIDLATHYQELYGQGDEMLNLARQLAAKQLKSLEAQSSIVESIQWHVRELMVSGAPRRETVAGRLGMSPSTLDRRLKDAGFNWQQLVDRIRAQLSVDYLADPTLSVADVAARLGFTDVRAFQRRFKHWMGVTPGQFRQR